MISEITLNGKPAVKVFAKQILWGSKVQGAKAKLYDIDGDKKWVPFSVSKFEKSKESQEQLDRGFHKGDVTGTLIIEQWFFNKLFPNG